jgi:hypothetical protein
MYAPEQSVPMVEICVMKACLYCAERQHDLNFSITFHVPCMIVHILFLHVVVEFLPSSLSYCVAQFCTKKR